MSQLSKPLITKRVNKKCTVSLRSPLKHSFTLSKLRLFGLRTPKTTSFYSLSTFYYCIANNSSSVYSTPLHVILSTVPGAIVTLSKEVEARLSTPTCAPSCIARREP